MHKDTPTLEDRVLAIKLRIAQFKAEHPGLYTSHTTTSTARTATSKPTSISDRLKQHAYTSTKR